jgi:hypothetical protein
VTDAAPGPSLDTDALDAVERRFWRGIWGSVSTEERAARGIECERFGPVQATVVTSLPETRWLNLILGATRPDAVADGHLTAAVEWAEARGVKHYVPITPDQAETAAAEDWLLENGYRRGYGWMKFVRDTSPPSAPEPELDGIELAELSVGEGGDFGAIVATGFGLPAWASVLFEDLPGRNGWRLYLALVDGAPAASAAMLIEAGVAQFGVAATLEPARGRGCQLALLRRRILDARGAGCHTLFVETGEPTDGKPSGSYRNILRAGFREAYVRPNLERPAY